MERYIGLPPREVRVWDEQKDERLETPLDSLGRVDLDELVDRVKQTVDEEYAWVSPFNDIHHLQCPASSYHSENGDDLGFLFRELANRKAYFPRLFHNWTHYVTLPPPVPDSEVMHQSIMAEQAARALASTAELAVRLMRKPGIPEAKLLKRLEEEFDNYTLFIENAREVPEEFQLIKLAEVEAGSIDEMLAVNRRLGKMALRHIPVRHRELRAA